MRLVVEVLLARAIRSTSALMSPSAAADRAADPAVNLAAAGIMPPSPADASAWCVATRYLEARLQVRA